MLLLKMKHKGQMQATMNQFLRNGKVTLAQPQKSSHRLIQGKVLAG